MTDARCSFCDMPATMVLSESGLHDDLACREHAEQYGYTYDDISELLELLEIVSNF